MSLGDGRPGRSRQSWEGKTIDEMTTEELQAFGKYMNDLSQEMQDVIDSLNQRALERSQEANERQMQRELWRRYRAQQDAENMRYQRFLRQLNQDLPLDPPLGGPYGPPLPGWP